MGAGFTLLELLFVLFLSSLLLRSAFMLASYWVQENQLSLMTKSLFNTLNLARSYAIRSEQRITVCASTSGTDCDTHHYERGWLVFVEHPSSANGQLDRNEKLLLLSPRHKQPFTIRSNSFASFITYNRFGQANRSGRFVLCAKNDAAAISALLISQSGRVRLARDSSADSDRIPEINGANISSCLADDV